MEIAIPVSVTSRVGDLAYKPGLCANTSFPGAGAYQLFTEAAFMRGAGRVVLTQDVIPQFGSQFIGYRSPHLGNTVISGEAVLPSLKVDGGFTRRPPKGLRTRKEFEELKRSGRIVVGPRSIGKISVVDQVIPANYTRKRTLEASCEVPRELIREIPDPCSSGQVAYAASLSDTAETRRQSMDFYGPMWNTGTSIRGTYGVFTTDSLTTLLTKHNGLINSAALAIEQAILHEPSSSLVTEGMAELNAASFDLLTELGELPETANMIFGACKKALRMYRDTRRKVRVTLSSGRPAAEIADAVASLWMAYRYGIMPIAYSIEDALTTLESQGIVFKTVRKGMDHSIPLDIPGWTFSQGLSYRERFWAKGRFGLYNNYGLGVNAPVSMWELLPLSFVVDWFINIGSLIAALSPSVDFSERGVTSSFACKMSLTGHHTDIPIPVTFSIDLYDRFEISPMAHVGLNLDGLMTWKRKLDALALSWFLFIKDFRK